MWIVGKAKLALSLASLLVFSACSTPNFKPRLGLVDAEINPVTVTEHTLKWLPAPSQQIPVAVYGLADETGAFRPSEGAQSLSRAVTQAPTPILIKALQDAGNRSWFSVIERENLQNLLKERQIILEMRERYLGERELNRAALPALKFAGVLIEGAITGYDTNTVTGGAGARYLGIGAFTEYREDAVSVYLRAVSVKTGEVLISITSEQRVASVALQGNAFRFVAFQELLEVDAGVTLNQPRHLAVRQAIEKAVYGIIVEGAEIGLWKFGDNQAGEAAIRHYRTAFAPRLNERFDDRLPPEFFADHERKRREAALQQQVTAQLAQRSPVAPPNQATAVGSQATVRPPSIQLPRLASTGPVAATPSPTNARDVTSQTVARRPQQAVGQAPQPTTVVAESVEALPADTDITDEKTSDDAARVAATDQVDQSPEQINTKTGAPQPAATTLAAASTAPPANPILYNRAVRDAVSMLKSVETEEPIDVTPDIARSLLAIGEGRAGELVVEPAAADTADRLVTSPVSPVSGDATGEIAAP
ncbi:MAG: CsgG/HfaB family protein [Pseudomonadota bacterium]